MRKEELKSQVFTIPNILTMLRIIAIPFFVWMTVDYSRWTLIGDYKYPLIGFIIMMLSAATDLLDGWVARKFNMTTALGAALDPVADKLMHVCTLVSLVIVGFVHWAFLVLIMLKELLMIVGGIVVMKYAQPIKANMYGKVASATLSAGVFLAFFHTIFALKVFYLDWIVISVAVVLTYVAFVGYIKQVIPIYKVILQAKKEGKDPNDFFSADAKVEESIQVSSKANSIESDEIEVVEVEVEQVDKE